MSLRLQFIFVYKCLIASALIFEKAVFPPLSCFCTFMKNHLSIFMWVYFQVLCCVLLICVYILPILHSLNYLISLKLVRLIPPTVFYFLPVGLDMLISLPFHINFGTQMCTKNITGILIGI